MNITVLKQLIALAFATVLSGGCASHVVLSPSFVLNDIQEVLAESVPAHSPLIDADIAVVVRVPLQGLHMANTGDERSIFTSFALPPQPEGLDEAATLAFYNAFYERMRESNGTNHVQRVDDIGPALAAALEHHLRQHFRTVSVVLEEGPGFVVEIQGSSRWALTKSADLVLSTLEGPSEIAAAMGHGERRTGRHLGWAIPVMLVLGLVLGSLVVSPIIGSISRSHYRGSIASALDEAASIWASGAAAAYTRDGGFAPAPMPIAVAVPVPAPAPAPPPATVSPPAPSLAQPVAVAPGPIACDETSPCPDAWFCNVGTCVSACNPTCATNEVCVSGGECVSLCNPLCPSGSACTSAGECVTQ